MRQMKETMQRILLSVPALLLACTATVSGSGPEYVAGHGRPIQCDGFLLEWSASSARRLGGDAPVFWDAVNTAEGLAGYIRWDAGDSCGPGSVEVDLCGGAGPVLSFPEDTIGTAGALYAVGYADTSTILEFCLPWDTTCLDTSDIYRIVISAGTLDGGTVGPVVLTGSPHTNLQRVFTRRIKVQLGVILVLLAGYLVLYVRLKRRNRRTESPRR
jgi:hypothetical protein